LAILFYACEGNITLIIGRLARLFLPSVRLCGTLYRKRGNIMAKYAFGGGISGEANKVARRKALKFETARSSRSKALTSRTLTSCHAFVP